jgi:GTP cyclohydrolase II
MNRIKKQLTEKIDYLKDGKALIYHHEQDGVSRSYLVLSADEIQDEIFNTFIGLCCNLSLLVNDEFLTQTHQKSYKHVSEVALKCDFSVGGIKSLLNSLEQGTESAGKDCIVMRVCKSDAILSDENAEARILEFMSNVDHAGGALLYGLITGDEGKPLEKAACPESLDALIITTDEIIVSRFCNPHLLEFTGVTEVELLQGTFALHSYYSEIDRCYHWAFVQDDGDKKKNPLVRIESECLTGHVFGSLLCDCGDQLSQGLAQIAEYGKGALVYLRQEGRGIGLKAKLEAYYQQQVHGLDTVDANIAVGMPEDARDYIIGAQILNSLGFENIKLLTNNPAKIKGLTRYGIGVEGTVSHIIPPSELNARYLETKKKRMGHKI